MNNFQSHILKVGLLLAAFAIGATLLVAVTERQTRDQITENQRQALLDGIHALIPDEQYDNAILQDTITLSATGELGLEEPQEAYRARLNGEPVAIVMPVVAPDGYSGRIRLLVGIYHDGTLAGVRVLEHRETPGLGDKIEVKRSDWITEFSGKSLDNPEPRNWRVKKDGGVFDQFTGATITPRAVINAVRGALEYYEINRDDLFAKQDVE